MHQSGPLTRALGEEGRLFEKDSPHRRGNADSAVWSVFLVVDCGRIDRRESVRFRILQGWMVTRIPVLIFGEIVEIGCLYFTILITSSTSLKDLYKALNKSGPRAVRITCLVLLSDKRQSSCSSSFLIW